MEEIRQNLLDISSGMASGKIESLRELRKLVVDLDLTKEAFNSDSTLFFVLYISKKLIGDVWKNLGTDSSFEFDEEKLTEFTISFGEVLHGLVSDGAQIQLIIDRLGKMTKWLYEYFARISSNPNLVFKGEKNERAKL